MVPDELLYKRGDNVTNRNISMTLGLIGVIGYFTGNILLVVIGGIYSVIRLLIMTIRDENIYQGTVILYVSLGIMFATYSGLPNNIGVFVGLCFESAISGIISLVFSRRN